MEISSPPIISPTKGHMPGGEGEVSIPETHGPFGNCIPVRVNQVIKGIEISQWPGIYRLIQE